MHTRIAIGFIQLNNLNNFYLLNNSIYNNYLFEPNEMVSSIVVQYEVIYLTLLTHLHPVSWFQAFLCIINNNIINNSIKHQSFVYTQVK